MSLYDYFGVANTQELYDLITNDDPRVDDLQNFLTYAKQEISYESPKVFNFEALFKLVNSEQLIPRENEAYIIGFSTQRNPTYYAKISGDMSEKEVLNIAFKADIKSYAIVDHPNIFSQDQDDVIRDIDCKPRNMDLLILKAMNILPIIKNLLLEMIAFMTCLKN